MPQPRTAPAILVVEDESLLRTVTADMLEYAGYNVLEAPTGEEALELLESGEPISGLFTDIELGGDVDGVTLARITHDRSPGTAIVVASGRRYPDDKDLPPGAVFLGKPYDFNHVIATLNQMLGPPSAV